MTRPLMLYSVLSFLIIMGPEISSSYRILGAFPLHGPSHFTMFEALMKGLARKGHQVDVISPFPLKNPYPNYTDIVYFDMKVPKFLNNVTYEYIHAISGDFTYFASTVIGNEICGGLDDPEILKIIRNPPKDPAYDLVLTEVLGANCFMALGPHFKVPTIGLSSSALFPWGNGMIGNPANLAFVPNTFVNYEAPMTFWQRLHNTVTTIHSDFRFQYYTTPQNDVIRKHFGPSAPGVRESERNLALILVNTHPALNGPHPVTSALVEVGGLHVFKDDCPESSADLKKWMDNSTDGFIYFTFGSMVMIESFPERVIKVFYKSLEKIAPVRVLIKIPHPEKLPPGLPSNFRTFVWASQCKVLQHKNIKAFITHGGLMGGQEAIHYAVPMIGIPLFSDQFINVDLYVRKKIAVKLNHREITEDKMDVALNEILHNSMYRNTMAKVSQRFLDRPMSSMDTAIWWVEYVIRDRGEILRSPAMDLSWWQIQLLDVYAVLLLIAALMLYATIAMIRLLLKLCFLKRKRVIWSSKKVQ